MLRNMLGRRSRVVALGVGAAAAISVPLVGLAGADTGVLSIGSTSLAPGGLTTITVDLQSTGSDVLDFSLVVMPQPGATGSFALSDIVTTKTPDPDPGVGWNCFAGTTANEVDCLWNGGGKDASKEATLTVTATASADAEGSFDVGALDNTAEDVLDSGVITVGPPATTSTTTAPSSTTSTTPGAAGAVAVTPSFTG